MVTKLQLLLLLCFCGGLLFGQQDPLQSFYMEHKLLLNPAYTGSRDGLSLTAQYRHQWTGLDGAPKTTAFSIHTPIGGGKNNLGLLIQDDRLGVSSETGVQLVYAYRVPLGQGRLSAGINAGVSRFQANLNEVFLFDNDPLFIAPESSWLPAAGAGIWYDTQNWYASFSVPHIYRSKYNSTGTAAQVLHFYGSAGYLFSINEQLQLRPSGLFRYALQSPSQFEADLALGLFSKVWLGAGYRTGSAVKGSILTTLSSGLAIGYTYDQQLNALKNINKGSHEILIRFEFADMGKGKSILSPRQSPVRAF